MKVAIVGGGASGLIASIVAKRQGFDVVIIEKQDRIGKKILITGNGRCNLTNLKLSPNNFHTNYKGNHFLPIKIMNLDKTLDFFRELGIIPYVEKNKVFPLSKQASSVLEVLMLEINRLNIAILLNSKVINLKKKDSHFEIDLIKENKKEKLIIDKIIVATGGQAGVIPDLTIYNILKSLGHNMLSLKPSLVQLLSSSNYCKIIKGIRVDCEVSIYRNNICEKKEVGEVLFTEDGLSGPAIFQVSRIASICKENNESCYVKLDLHSELNKEQLTKIIYERIEKNPTNTLEQLFIGWINKKIAVVIIKNSNIGSINRLCNELEYDEVERLVNSIKCLSFDIVGPRGFKFAQTTIGGISLDNVNLENMESKLISGLYIVGEILDVDGDCGGYNLQWAWSTGYIAGQLR